MDIEKIYYDLSTDKAYREDGSEIANTNIPEFRYKGKKQIQWQFLKSATRVNGAFTDFYTRFAGIAVSGSASVDNNAIHYDDGKPNVTITKAVSITNVAIKNLTRVPRICGRIRFTNASSETETLYYNDWHLTGAVYTFTLANSSYVSAAQTPTYTYLVTDDCRVLEIPILKDELIDVTGKATGLFVTTIDCFKRIFQDMIEGETEIKPCKLEIIIKDSTPENIMVKQIPVKLLYVQDDDGEVGPAPADSYTTNADLAAALLLGREIQFSINGSTSWHDIQVAADRYWRERYPDGEWSIAIAMILAPEVMFLYSVLGTDSWHTPYAGGDEYFKVSTDGGVTYSGAILFRGIQGIQGIPGTSAFVYTAYASDASGTGFSLTASSALRYRAEKHSATAIPSPIVTDFTGLFVLYLTGQWSEGSGVPSNSAGENGDKYLNNDNGNTYSKSAGTWSLIGNLRGPAFHVDAQGLLSTKGTYDAEAEDFSFLATDTGDVYFKNSGTSGDWSAPIAFQGDPGTDGVDSFTYVAYASDASGTDFNLTPSSNLKYRAEIHSGTAIVTPILSDFSGATWVKYIGDNGTNGANAFVYIGFASDASGTGWSQTPSISLPYMAVRLSSTVLTPIASDFTGLYVKYLGTNGTNGTNGSNGSNGTSSFVYIAYASDNTGTGWNLTPTALLPYMAVKQSATALTPVSSDFSGATWVKYLGTDGENTGTTIETLLFRVPNMEDNSSLHFALEVHETADYSGTAVETFNSATVQTNLKISDGEEWLAFPSEGVGNPYYSEKLSVALQSVESDIQYSIRYKWYVAETDPSKIPWLLSQYPALEINNLEDKKLPLASFALIAPDTSIWDIAIGNDGVITRIKRV